MFHKTLVRMDYAGISFMIAGSVTPPICYSFYCQEMHGTLFSLAYFDDIEWRNIYLGLVYFFCFCAFVLFLVPKFDQPRFRVLRGSTFVICGLLSGLPLIHIEFYTNQQYLKDFISFPWGLGGFLYILGAVMYMLKVPERFKPGFFDIIVSVNNVLSLTNSIGSISSILSPPDRDGSPASLQCKCEGIPRQIALHVSCANP